MGDEKLSQAGTERLNELEARIRAAVMELLVEAQQQTKGCSNPPRTQAELHAALNSNRKDHWIAAAKAHQRAQALADVLGLKCEELDIFEDLWG